MKAPPELAQACRLHRKIASHDAATEAERRACRALWLQATSKGATWAAILASCDITPSELNAELKKARRETDDPALRKDRGLHRGLSLGVFFCPERGCNRAQGNGNEPFDSSQAMALHRQKAHGYRLGKNAMSAEIVRKLRAAPAEVTTSVLADRYGVSYHAARSARAFKTWRSVG